MVKTLRDNLYSLYFSGKTRDVAFRKKNLRALERAVRKWEPLLCEALWQDLHKSYEEAYMTEISIVLGEIRAQIKNVSRWARPQKCPTPLKLFPSRTKVISEPLGAALIIAPWNYPVHLLLVPLAGALAAGCTVMLKPSPYAPTVAGVIYAMISETFDKNCVAVVRGHRDMNAFLLDLRWDIIFCTGSPSLGKTVMEAAAKHLTPVVLELGGKSPCIIDKDADLRIAAKRVAWGKSLNAGQTCVAPDYLLLQSDIREEFLTMLEEEFRKLLGDDPQKSKYYVRIVNDKAMERLTGYLKIKDEIVFGGKVDREDRYISPTVMKGANEELPVLEDEIFGPIFPYLEFEEIEEATAYVSLEERPLALYYFGKKNADFVIHDTSSGAVCINDVVMHIANGNAPFGGVGMSGMGAYHHKKSFDAFSHYRTVLTTPTWLDMPFRYMPYRWFNLIKDLL